MVILEVKLSDYSIKKPFDSTTFQTQGLSPAKAEMWMTACHEIHVGTGKSILKQQQRTTLRERNLQ